MDLNRFDKSWFAIHIRPRHEFIAAFILRNKVLEEFLRSYKSKRQWSGGQKEIKLPLFPSYVFCRFDACSQVPILTTPGVVIAGVFQFLNDKRPSTGTQTPALRADSILGVPNLKRTVQPLKKESSLLTANYCKR